MLIECYPPEVDFALPVIIGVPVGDGATVDVALPVIIGVPVGDSAAVDVGSGSVILVCWTPSIVPPAVGIAIHILITTVQKGYNPPFWCDICNTH